MTPEIYSDYISLSVFYYVMGGVCAAVLGLAGFTAWLVKILVQYLEAARKNQLETAEKVLPLAAKLADMLPVIAELVRSATSRQIQKDSNRKEGE